MVDSGRSRASLRQNGDKSPRIRLGGRGHGVADARPRRTRLWTLNTPRVPEGIDDAKVRNYLLDEHGIEISGGFGPLAGKIFRIGTMGTSSNDADIRRTLEALRQALRLQGYEPKVAAGKA